MKLNEIGNKRQLLNILKCTPEFLEKMENQTYEIFEASSGRKTSLDVAIKKFLIPKKNRDLGFRVIHKPHSNNLEFCLKILNSHLLDLYIPNQCVHGFVRKRNILSNANLHLAKKTILSIDLKNFFDTITREQIESSLIDLGIEGEIAKSLSYVVTLNGSLVQGFSTSPTIANIVSTKLDFDLQNSNQEITYSRYADDMYFSSNNSIPDASLIEKIINFHGFEVNHEKTKLMKRGQNQYVTGLSVFDSNYPRIPKKIKRNIRLELHYIEKVGFKNHLIKKLNLTEEEYDSETFEHMIEQEKIETLIRISGWLKFIHSIEPIYSKKYIEILKNLSI